MASKFRDDVERELERLAQLSGAETTDDRLLVYGTDKGVKIDIRYAGETLWMTQAQIGQLFGKTVSTISRHITNVFDAGELIEEGNLQKTQIAGATKPVALYSLDVIISVGYRVNSKQATQFRIWATERLKEILLKGWSIDVARMKNPESRDHLKELKETIRDIRASEANLYREVRSICAMCRDYDPQSEEWRNFYAGMQNKLLWAVASKTGPELILERANAEAENMGLTTWANENIRKNDVCIANNFLAGAEIREKNRLTTMLLDYFEDQVDIGRLVMMAEAEERMNGFIKFNNRPLLTHLEASNVKRHRLTPNASLKNSRKSAGL
ncbi:RhuM family protein [Mesorhizobium sp.]|jgi:hypothetical protein|uniref:RhuM family protein n=1 Tax=Mesorhizobium sp. TaxID=1871066 RepID=UPI00356245DC